MKIPPRSVIGAAMKSVKEAATASNSQAPSNLTKSRGFKTVYWDTVIEKDKTTGKAKVTDPGHIAVVLTEEERLEHQLPGRHFGHLVTKREEIAAPKTFDGPGGEKVTVSPWLGPVTKNFCQDKPIDMAHPAVRQIDHGSLTAEQAAVLRAVADKPFHKRYDTTGETAPNCVTAANTLHRLLNLTNKKVPAFTTTQDAAKLVEEKK